MITTTHIFLYPYTQIIISASTIVFKVFAMESPTTTFLSLSPLQPNDHQFIKHSKNKLQGITLLVLYLSLGMTQPRPHQFPTFTHMITTKNIHLHHSTLMLNNATNILFKIFATESPTTTFFSLSSLHPNHNQFIKHSNNKIVRD